MLNVYATPISPFAMKLQYFLEEAQIPYKYHNVNLFDPASRAALEAYNPLSKVPAIELDGFSMGESNAIMAYLSARYEKYSFHPVNLEDRAKVDVLTEFGNLHLNRWFMAVAFNLVLGPKLGFPVNEPMLAEGRKNLPDMLARFDRVIAGRTYLAGPDLTIADCNLLPFASTWKMCQLNMDAYPNVLRWVTRLTERPAWKKVEQTTDQAMSAFLASRKK